jgi:hypothetical protein
MAAPTIVATACSSCWRASGLQGITLVLLLIALLLAVR